MAAPLRLATSRFLLTPYRHQEQIGCGAPPACLGDQDVERVTRQIIGERFEPVDCQSTMPLKNIAKIVIVMIQNIAFWPALYRRNSGKRSASWLTSDPIGA